MSSGSRENSGRRCTSPGAVTTRPRAGRRSDASTHAAVAVGRPVRHVPRPDEDGPRLVDGDDDLVGRLGHEAPGFLDDRRGIDHLPDPPVLGRPHEPQPGDVALEQRGLGLTALVEFDVGQGDPAHRVIVDPTAIVGQRQVGFVQDLVAVDVDLAFPPASDRDLGGDEGDLPVTGGERDLDPTRRAAGVRHQVDHRIVIARFGGRIADVIGARDAGQRPSRAPAGRPRR